MHQDPTPLPSAVELLTALADIHGPAALAQRLTKGSLVSVAVESMADDQLDPQDRERIAELAVEAIREARRSMMEEYLRFIDQLVRRVAIAPKEVPHA